MKIVGIFFTDSGFFLFSERVSQKIKAVWISKRSFCCVKK